MPPSKKPKTSTRPTKSRTDSGDWLAWLATTDPAEREALRRDIETVEETKYEGVAELGKLMIQGLISGTVSPSVSQEARGWAEIMLAAQATQLAASRPEGSSTNTSIILALGDLQKREERQIEARYTIDGEVEAEKVALEQLLAGNDE